jgi:HD superfamily phosphohydrolase YqeK
MQGALTGRSLYPPGHPRVLHGEQRALELLEECLDRKPEITIFAVEERVIFDEEVLPASPTLAQTLFAPLHKSGVDRITFLRGLKREELGRLLDDLSETTKGRQRIEPVPHIRFGFIRDVESTGGGGAVAQPRLALPYELSSVLSDVWTDVHEERTVEVDLIEDIVTSVTKAVRDSQTTMLPLAALKKHDEYTFVHTINVAILSTALGETLGFSGKTAHELNMAALLHDVGKKMIPIELLNKQGRFTEEEFNLVQAHPVVGARMLLATPGVSELAAIVAYEHHVRMDGKGYPKLPRGWKLNLASRIVQVADVFDALRTERPYRKALPLPKIIEIMKKDVGVFFDADLLDLFLDRVVDRVDPAPVEIDF